MYAFRLLFMTLVQIAGVNVHVNDRRHCGGRWLCSCFATRGPGALQSCIQTPGRIKITIKTHIMHIFRLYF